MTQWTTPGGFGDDDAGRRAVPHPPSTGDPGIDAALEELAIASVGPMAGRIRAGEQTLEVLQSRLRDLGGE